MRQAEEFGGNWEGERGWGGGDIAKATLKPVLNWANVCSPEHTSDTSTNYDSFLN